MTRGNELAELIDDNELFICNEPPHPPTFVRDTGVQNSSHIDITIASAGAFNNITNWQVSGDMFESDHCSLTCNYRYGMRERLVANVQVAIPWKKPNSKMQDVMVQVLGSCKKEMRWVNRIEEVDKVIEQHSEQIRNMLHSIFKKGKKQERMKVYWWSEQVKKAYQAMRKARCRMRRYRYNNLKDEFNACRKEFRKEVRRAKVEAWHKFTTGTTNPWDKLIKIVKATMTGRIQSRTLSDLEGNFACSMRETLWLLGRQFFPQPDIKERVHLDIEILVEKELIGVGRGPEITVTEFRKALSEMSMGTAPGLDMVTNNVLKVLAVEGRLEQKYLKSFNICLRHHYFPIAWKKAKITLIPKPTTLSNSAKSFRPISLTSAYTKLFERIILARLLHYLSLSNKMVLNQHAYKKGASTQTALYDVFNVVQSALTKRGGGLCVIVFLDISGAFDCIWHHGILYKLIMYGVPLYLVAWIKDFLHGRTAYFNEGNEEHEVTLEQGCPQGGVLSPVLWNVLFNEMLALPIAASKDRLHCMKVVGYADDAAIVCKGSTIELITAAANEQLKKIKEWSVINRVKFNPAKLAVLTVTNKIQRPMPAVVYYDNVPIHEVAVYKYLGLLVDNKLQWNVHVNDVLRRLTLITRSLSGLARGKWGVSLDIYRMLYKAIFVPVMMYGIGIWGWKASSRTVCDKFDKEIRRFGLMATRCHKSTSNMFIWHLMQTQSFMYLMHSEVLKVSVSQFHVFDSHRRQVYETYRRNRILREVPQCMDQQFYMLRRGIEQQLEDVEFDDVNKQYKAHPATWAPARAIVHEKVRAMGEAADKRGWVIFTDASASSYGIGWGYVAFKNGFNQVMSYGSLTKCTVFTAEAYALLQAVRYANSLLGLRKNEEVEIRSDARGLVQTLGGYVHTDTLLCMIKDELRKAFHDGKNIVLRWVPGHSDVMGNEWADRIAKKAVDSGSTTNMRVTKKDVIRFLKERETAQKSNVWEQFESRNVKMFLPDVNALNRFIKSSPSVALCQIVSGHTRLNDFVCRKLGLLRSAMCECGEDNETVTRYLMDCPLYESLRKEIWEDYQADYDFITKDWGKLNEFVNKTGRFARSMRESLEKMGENVIVQKNQVV